MRAFTSPYCARRRQFENSSHHAAKRVPWFARPGIVLTWLVMSCSMAAQPVHFAVIGGVPANPSQEPQVRRLLTAIAERPGIDFILDDGNLKGPREPCTDTLLQDRQALLNSSTLPLVFVPGANDWVDCQQAAAGHYDPLERLDQLRDLIFSTADSMGVSGIPLTHESDVTRFRNFHENTEWQKGPVLFVTLNVASNNNHYLDAGGRNGEFDDRTIANRYWLEHALRSARQHRPAAVVIAIEGDPGLGVQPHHGAFDWLDFRRAQQRDGYLEFKHDLLKFSQQYDGPILLINQVQEHLGSEIHRAPAAVPPAFRLTPPPHRKNSGPLGKIWRLELYASNDPTHWVSVEIVTGRETIFNVSLQTVPAELPTQAAEPASSVMPASAALPPVALPVPVLQIPGTTDNGRAPGPRPGN